MNTPARLTLLYDGQCSGCTRAAQWFLAQEALVPMDAISLHDAALIQLRFPGLPVPADQFAAVAQEADGRFTLHAGGDGWWLALWAQKRTRKLAERLDRAGMRPLARRAYAVAAANRFWISRLLFGPRPCNLQSDRAAQTENRAMTCGLDPKKKTP